MKYEPAIDFGDEGHACGSQLSKSDEVDEMSFHRERLLVVRERLLGVGLRLIVDHEDTAGIVTGMKLDCTQARSG